MKASSVRISSGSFIFLIGICSLRTVQATERLIPGQHATIQAAIDSSSTGDTLTVTDSNSYGQINLAKDVLLRAGPVAAPIITGSSVLSLGEIRAMTFRRKVCS